MAASSTGKRKRWELRPESELRFEVSGDETFTLVLQSGTAEIFGCELVPGKEYVFYDTKLAAFTWYGAVLETSESEGVYVSEETPMVAYANTHAQLEARRDTALANEGHGPRVLIVGQVDSGKSSLASLLTAYALRLGRCPVFVDLDVGQGNVGVPGTIGALPLDSSTLPLPPSTSTSTSSSSSSSSTSSSSVTPAHLSSLLSLLPYPLSFFYGHDNLSKNAELFRGLVGRLAGGIEERLALDKEARGAGLIVNTAGWIDGLGLSLLLHSVQALKIDVVLVLGHDKLYADMAGALSGKGVTIVKLPRSGGVVHRDARYRRATRMKRIHQYFYGPSLGPGIPPSLAPAALELPFDDVTILRIGDSGISASIAPIGVDTRPDPLAIQVVEPHAGLLHALLAVLHPPPSSSSSSSLPPFRRRAGEPGAEENEDEDEDEEDEEVDPALVHSNAAGFVHVTGVDLERKKFRFLAPCPGALPSRYLVVGSVVWVEEGT